jgi:hypothetical protein
LKIPSENKNKNNNNNNVTTATVVAIKNDTNVKNTTGNATTLQSALEQARSELVSLQRQQHKHPSHPLVTTSGSSSTKQSNDSGTVILPSTKKINADLQHQIKKKLQLLEQRTQKALIVLLQQRLEQEAATTIILDP